MVAAFLPSVVTSTSKSAAHARQRSLALYRQWLRSLPTIADIYKLTLPPQTIKNRVRQEFEKNRFVSDPKVIDVLLFKGRIELEESVNSFKQETHIMRFFDNDEYKVNRKGFLNEFYKGK